MLRERGGRKIVLVAGPSNPEVFPPATVNIFGPSVKFVSEVSGIKRIGVSAQPTRLKNTRSWWMRFGDGACLVT